MGEIAEAAQGFRVTEPGPRCWYENLIEVIDDEEVNDLDSMLGDRTVSNTKISKVLRSIGVPISGAQIGYHRRGDCRCQIEHRPARKYHRAI